MYYILLRRRLCKSRNFPLIFTAKFLFPSFRQFPEIDEGKRKLECHLYRQLQFLVECFSYYVDIQVKDFSIFNKFTKRRETFAKTLFFLKKKSSSNVSKFKKKEVFFTSLENNFLKKKAKSA